VNWGAPVVEGKLGGRVAPNAEGRLAPPKVVGGRVKGGVAREEEGGRTEEARGREEKSKPAVPKDVAGRELIELIEGVESGREEKERGEEKVGRGEEYEERGRERGLEKVERGVEEKEALATGVWKVGVEEGRKEVESVEEGRNEAVGRAHE